MFCKKIATILITSPGIFTLIICIIYMWALFYKEITSFFGSLIGYLVVIVFLAAMSLFLWVFPGSFNIPEAGFAQLDPLFSLAPFVFMFLIPAITMRTFSDEFRLGTIELLATKPITDMQIVWAKYLAGIMLVIISLIPTLVYYYSVYQLGMEIGNLDKGGTWGSYIGLLFLASSFVSMGIYASSLTDNTIVAFVLGMLFCFIFYLGFDLIAMSGYFPTIDYYFYQLGINEHYLSMSRGVIDSRDVVYFFSINLIFIYLTYMKLVSRKW